MGLKTRYGIESCSPDVESSELLLLSATTLQVKETLSPWLVFTTVGIHVSQPLPFTVKSICGVGTLQTCISLWYHDIRKG